MKSVLIIGMSRFGRHMAVNFSQMGNEVMAVDINEDKINDIASKVTSAQIGDCANEQVLKSLGVRNFDICVVAIGNNFQASLEVTSLLKELGAVHVIANANRDIHAKFLIRNGADEVVDPERQMAEKLAMKYSVNNVFDYIQLTTEYSIFEIPPMDAWIGKTIEQCNVRNKYHINILAIKEGGQIFPLPKPDYVFRANQHLMVLGKKDEIIKLVKKA